MDKTYTAIEDFEAPDHGGVIKTWDVLTLPEALGRKWVKGRYVKEGVHKQPPPAEPKQQPKKGREVKGDGRV